MDFRPEEPELVEAVKSDAIDDLRDTRVGDGDSITATLASDDKDWLRCFGDEGDGVDGADVDGVVLNAGLITTGEGDSGVDSARTASTTSTMGVTGAAFGVGVVGLSVSAKASGSGPSSAITR